MLGANIRAPVLISICVSTVLNEGPIRLLPLAKRLSLDRIGDFGGGYHPETSLSSFQSSEFNFDSDSELQCPVDVWFSNRNVLFIGLGV